jgi:hypothetical protein
MDDVDEEPEEFSESDDSSSDDDSDSDSEAGLYSCCVHLTHSIPLVFYGSPS